jgi:hypothetical protein
MAKLGHTPINSFTPEDSSMFKTALLTAAIGLATVSAAHAVPFTDNFDAYGSGTVLNAPDSLFNGVWATTDGTVDYLAPPPAAFSGLCRDTGSCIDLDGSTGNGGIFSTVQSFAAGTYVLSIELFGNGRGAAADTVIITLGDWTATIAEILSEADRSGTFRVETTTGGVLSFEDTGSDNQGAILSSVSIAAVPVPAGGLLLLGALGGLAALRRRKAQVA